MNLLSKILSKNSANFGASDDLAAASLTKTPTPTNPTGNGAKPVASSEDREKVSSTFLNINRKSTDEIKRFRTVKKKDKNEKRLIEKQNQISRRKQMKPPVLASSLKKNMKRQKDIEADTEMSPLI